jgi:ferrous iron transport protein B
MTDQPENSILAVVAGILSPLLKPVGLGDWRIVTSLIGGFLAKESVVSTMEILFPDGVATLGTAAASAMLVFSLLYTPCVAAIASVRRELGAKWAVAVALGQCVIAWIAAFGVYWIGVALGGR